MFIKIVRGESQYIYYVFLFFVIIIYINYKKNKKLMETTSPSDKIFLYLVLQKINLTKGRQSSGVDQTIIYIYMLRKRKKIIRVGNKYVVLITFFINIYKILYYLCEKHAYLATDDFSSRMIVFQCLLHHLL